MSTKDRVLEPNLASSTPFCKELKDESFDIGMSSIDFEGEKRLQKY